MAKSLRKSFATAAALSASWSTATYAHPGPHEGETGGLLHAVTQPDHLLALLLIAAAALWAPRLFRAAAAMRRRRAPAPVRIIGTMDAK